MIPIDYPGNVEKTSTKRPNKYAIFLEEYYKLLVPKNKSQKVNKLDNWCKANISLEKETVGDVWTFKDVVCASPHNIIKLKYLIDDLSDKDRRQLVEIASYVVTSLYSDRMGKHGAREHLEKHVNTHVCPYCNRNLISQIMKADKKHTTCDLDHFVNKGGTKGKNENGYPLLAVSYFNLIPTCKYCNRIKHDKELRAFYPYMFGWNDTGKIRFSYYPTKCNYLNNIDSFEIGIIIDSSMDNTSNDIEMNNIYTGWRRDNIIHDIDILNLVEVYQSNRYDVQRLLKRNLIYSDSYSTMMYDGFEQYFSSEQEITDLMRDNPEETEIANISLGKLKRDIMKELQSLSHYT